MLRLIGKFAIAYIIGKVIVAGLYIIKLFIRKYNIFII